ncbi:hypothetical protein ACFDTO_22565 [Microbacteriaceae bacterium 4G12]
MFNKISNNVHWILLVLITISIVNSIYQLIKDTIHFDYISFGFGVIGFIGVSCLVIAIEKQKKKKKAGK